MISDGVDVVSHTAGTLIFSPTAYEFLWVSLGFLSGFVRHQLISLGSKGRC